MHFHSSRASRAMRARSAHQLVLVPSEQTDGRCSRCTGTSHGEVPLLVAAKFDLIYNLDSSSRLSTHGHPSGVPWRTVPEPLGPQRQQAQG